MSLFVSPLDGKENVTVTSCLLGHHISSKASDVLRYRELVEASEHGEFFVL